MTTRLSVVTASAIACLSLGVGADQITRQNGAPVGNNQNSQTAGPWGPVLLQDSHLIEKLASFDRERIPERVVHARGTGVHGYYENTEDLSDLTAAAPFSAAGKKTDVFVRFSAVIHPKGSPETLRDPRGFAVKFYTEQGNWDLVGNNFPVFFIRDAIKFPDMVHSLKPSPVTNAQDPNRFFDFFSHIPESTHMLTFLYSDLGTPKSYLNMDGSGVHAFKFVNAEGKVQYVKFTWKSNQPIESFTAKEAGQTQSTDFQPHTTDIYAKIGAGETASWDLHVQTLDPSRLNDFDFNPLDTTKIWPLDLIPSRKVGRLVLNRVPDNFFEETEQAAFAPSNMIPGIEPSEDRMLQGRLFSYADTQRYRLGGNHLNLPVNAPRNAGTNNHTQEGQSSHTNTKRDVNYQPSRRSAALKDDSKYSYSQSAISDTTQQAPIHKLQNFKQAGELYRSFTETERANLVSNVAGDLGRVESEEIRVIISAYFYNADPEYGTQIAKAVGVSLDNVKPVAAELMKEQSELTQRAVPAPATASRATPANG